MHRTFPGGDHCGADGGATGATGLAVVVTLLSRTVVGYCLFKTFTKGHHSIDCTGGLLPIKTFTKGRQITGVTGTLLLGPALRRIDGVG
jgi:hypothetical protein